MVEPRKFTAPEWRDLARGCRFLVQKDEEGIKRNAGTTVVGNFEASKKVHLELIELCEERANRIDAAQFAASRRR